MFSSPEIKYLMVLSGKIVPFLQHDTEVLKLTMIEMIFIPKYFFPSTRENPLPHLMLLLKKNEDARGI